MEHIFSLIFISTAFALPLSACAQEPEQSPTVKSHEMTQYMFVGHVSPEGWKFILDNPSDREEVARVAVKKMGGELLSYHFGFGNSKNYIIASLPDKKTAKAAQILRLSSGLLVDYEIIELMSPAEIQSIAESMQKLRDIDDIQKDD